jgi:predicted GNAT family acetyltransferase
MRCHIEPDLATFAGHALPFLERDPVRNNSAYSLVAERHLGGWPTDPGTLWISVTDDDGELVGLALHVPPFPAVHLTEMPHDAVLALADHLAASQPRLPGVSGPVGPAREFALRWTALTGATVTPAASRRLYRLHRLTRPAAVEGRLREAHQQDRDLLVRWAAAFSLEATPERRQPPTARPIDIRLARGGMLWLWEADQRTVSSLWFHLPAAGVVRISGVYTPPEHRGRGYASACVATASQAALDRGAVACVLNTDLANPTSNRIYHAIGYRPVYDSQIWSFQPDQDGPLAPEGGAPSDR